MQTIQLRRSWAPELQRTLHLVVPISRSVLSAAVYIPGKWGSLQVEIVAEARRQGMLVVQIPLEQRSLWIALLHHRALLLLVNQALCGRNGF